MNRIHMEAQPIDLRLTLIDSGQCFRWQETPRGFVAVFSGQPVFLRPGEDFLQGDWADFLRDYLDLERDYAAIREEYSGFPHVRRAMELYPGLRVLNQPAWETTISFILSANNNVARITKLVRALSERYGERVETECGPLYGFPGAEALAAADEASLRALGVGYRAPYILQTARMVLEGFPLEALRAMPYEVAHAELLRLPGVGDKVADCVLLFGCGQTSAFPVDVWVSRLLGDWFDMRAPSRPALKRMAREVFGEHGGLMQQYLFHAARMGAIPVRKQPDADGGCGAADQRMPDGAESK